MDELKDEDIDRKLFPNRPLPSGRVSTGDIKQTLAGAMILYIAAHFFAGAALWTALLVLGYSVLMFKRFFAPELLRGNLIITLITHNPIVPLMLCQGFVIFAAQHGLSLKVLRGDLIVPFVIMLWLSFLAWELARKIRAPEQENAYVTYSRLFGRVGAVGVTAAIQAMAFCIGLYFWRRFSLSWVYIAILTFGLLCIFVGYCRFVLHPSARTARLKHYAATFLICTEVAQLAGFGRLVWRMGE
jgi:4-hydroxybenzoate polyprenyltransferase